VLIGRVSEINCDKVSTNVRVIMPDRVDHDNNPLITKPVPVLQQASTAKKSFAVPRVGTNVMMIKMPNGTSNYLVLGSFYTTSDPPPVDDPMLDHTTYDDGSIKQFDANSGTETNKFKGDTIWDHQGKGDLHFKGNVSLKSDGTITLEASTIYLKGFVDHTGDMRTSGIHNAQDGPHAACGAGERLEQANIAQRIAELERRVAELEAQRGS